MNAADPLVVTLLPIDDRPVNTDDVATLAAISGVELRLPPAEFLPPRGEPGDRDALAQWLDSSAADSDGLVVSINQLLYGGYVASRRTTEPTLPLLRRLELLRSLRGKYPDLPIHGFMTLMRTRRLNGAGAEPRYWAQHGADMFELSRELYRLEHGQPSDVPSHRALIPPEHITDFMVRRMRLHAMQLAGLELATDHTLDTFWILVEDSTVESVSTSEREWLTAWIERLAITDRAMCLPGADEAGGSLIMRTILELRERRPKVFVECAEPAGIDRIALFEDVPVHQTVQQQVTMAGADLTTDAENADLVLALHPPSATPRDWCWPEVPSREQDISPLITRISAHLAQGRAVTVADTADANGSDPALIRALCRDNLFGALAGYAGWNTAGNSIGSALAMGLASLQPGVDADHHQRVAMTRRLLDDWAFQTVARRTVLRTGCLDVESTEADLLTSQAELGLSSDHPVLRPGSTRFPWNRSFEIAFEFDLPSRKAHPS